VTDLERLADIVERGSIKEVRSCVRKLLDSGVSPEEVVSHGFMPGLAIVGQKFDEGEYFITNMLLSARAVKMGYEILRPELGDSSIVSNRKVVLGTVQGDLHNIGKNLVAMAIRGVGVEVVDLGVDVPVEQFVKAVEQDPNVAYVGVSALLNTTIPAMRATVKALKKSRAANRIKIMVGGTPVTARMAAEMKADVYTESAFEAANLILEDLRSRT
jgi:5-methyltetrahydrofolate--homocysteine methyltransferase